MREYAYVTVDVFTNVRFGGNPLAVFPDARGLDSATMQQIATEFNYSEVTFVLPPTDAANTAQVRIFTPTTEVPFAGHPNVGTAFVLARQDALFGKVPGAHMRFEEQAGLVDVSIVHEEGRVRGATITAPRRLELGPEVPPALVAACASLAPEALVLTEHPPRFVSVGLPFVVAQVASRAALAQAKPNPALFADAQAAFPHGDGGFALFLYLPTPAEPQHFSARMFAPLDNVMEDPATGSASAALAAYWASRRPEADGTYDLVVEQGVDMGRPSTLLLHVHKAVGLVQQVQVGGSCVPVMRGVIEL